MVVQLLSFFRTRCDWVANQLDKHSDSQKTLQTLRCGLHCLWQLMVPILRLRAPRVRM